MLLKTLLIIYPKNDKQNLVTKCVVTAYCKLSRSWCSRSTKWLFLKFLQNSQENTCPGVFFLINLKAFSPQLYLTRDSSAGVFR